MKGKCFVFIAIILVCAACNVSKTRSFSPAKKYSPAELKQDFSVLKSILETNHPSLYWYSTPDSINFLFSELENSLTDSLTEADFRNRVSRTVSKIHCGHTATRPSQEMSKYHSKRTLLPQFPLMLKVWDDSAVVVNNLFRDDSTFKRGTIVTSINGYSPEKIIDSISQFISSDGYTNTFKAQLISFNFPAFYRNSFGIDSQYVVKFIDSTGLERQALLKNFEPKSDTALKLPEAPGGFLTRKQFRKLRLSAERNMQIDTSISTAILSVNTFSEGRLNNFFRQSFRKIKRDGVQNIILDLRLNSGGSVLTCTRLSQYLVDKPFHIADTIAAVTRSFPYKKHIRPWFIYWLSMHLSTRKNLDGRYHFRYFERHYYKPKKKNHFDGNIYLLTGGYTFSAATLVTHNLKGQKNVTVVGEETGGGAYGNTSMHITNIILPNTRIRITLPLFRMVLNANAVKNGRGIMPDIEVKPSSLFIKKGQDAKLEKTKELIKNRSGKDP